MHLLQEDKASSQVSRPGLPSQRQGSLISGSSPVSRVLTCEAV